MKNKKNLLSICLIATVMQTGWLTHTDKVNNFQVSYPETWTQSEQSGVAYFFAPVVEGATFRENVNVLKQDTKDMTLAEYEKLSVTQIKGMGGDSAIIQLKDTTLAGLPAKKCVFAAPMQGLRLKFLGYWIIKDKKAFVITYTASQSTYQKYVGDAQRIAASLKFTK